MSTRIKFLQTPNLSKTPVGEDVEGVVTIEETASENLVNPANIADRDYYYNKDTGEQVANTDHYILSMDNLIVLGEVPIVCYFRANVTLSGTHRVFYALCYDANDVFLGASTSANYTTTNSQRIVLKSGTRKVRFQIERYLGGSSITPEKSCFSLEKLTEFVPYGMVESKSINDEMLTDFRNGIFEELTTETESQNIVNPAKFKTWGYDYAIYQGTYQTANDKWQAQLEKIETDSAVDLYAKVRTVQSGGSTATCYVVCWDANDTWLATKSDFKMNTTSVQHITLPTETAKIALEIDAYDYYFNPADLCVSFLPLEDFVEYGGNMVIKPELLGSSEETPTLYREEIVVFGDSIFAGSIPSYIGQITKANVYNAALGGTAASDKNPSGGAYTHYLCMFSIAHAINTGDWSAILTSAQGTNRAYDYVRMLHCSQIDWSKVNIIIIAHGANDTYSGAENPNDPLDVTYYSGAMRYSIDQIQSAYPNIRIFCCNVINSIGQAQPNRAAGNAKLKEICDEYHVGYIDNYTNLGINENTVEYYLGSEKIHPNDRGARLIARHVSHELW